MMPQSAAGPGRGVVSCSALGGYLLQAHVMPCDTCVKLQIQPDTLSYLRRGMSKGI
jgi:hypothetical protein